MTKEKIIIQGLLALIDSYDKNEIAKEQILGVITTPNEGETVIIKINTKGEVNKETPFYFGSIYTNITEEYGKDNEESWANMLYWNKTNL